MNGRGGDALLIELGQRVSSQTNQGVQLRLRLRHIEEGEVFHVAVEPFFDGVAAANFGTCVVTIEFRTANLSV
jgi:hypothetical protein